MESLNQVAAVQPRGDPAAGAGAQQEAQQDPAQGRGSAPRRLLHQHDHL